jgi:predicted MFS family arabinose efflux permease
MTGLKLLADKVDARMLSRAAAGHAASIGVSGALSYLCADLLAQAGGWRFAFAAAALSAAVAWCIIARAVPRRPQPPEPSAGATLFDFRPVLRNRSAMAYAVAYGLHTLEMAALRGWGVAFLAYVAASTGAGGSLSPTAALTILALIGTLASLAGNEAAIRFGRRALVAVAIAGSMALAALLATVGARSYPLAVVLMLIYGAVIWLDSASLTAGTAGTAEPSRRGATLAVHSTLGYFGGFVGPLAVGWVLDYGGGNSDAWSAAFWMIAAVMLLSLVLFVAMRPRGLAGDRA